MLRIHPVVLLFASWILAALTWLPSGLVPVHGIYPGGDRGSCCWMGPSAVFTVRAPSQADTIVIEIFAPPYALGATPVGAEMSIQGQSPVRRCCIRNGITDLTFPLPTARPRGVTRIQFSVSHSFVPSAVIGNGDRRRLSFLLRSVTFEDSKTGERFGNIDPDAGIRLPWTLDLFLVAACALFAGALTLRHPAFAVVALIASDPFSLAEPLGMTTITLAKAVLVSVGLALLPALFRSRLRFGRSFWLVLAGSLATLVSMLLSSVHAASSQAAVRETLKSAEYVATFLCAYVSYRLEPEMRYVRAAILGISIAVSSLAVLQLLARLPDIATLTIGTMTVPRLSGPLEGPNQLAAFFGVVVPVILAFAATDTSRRLDRIVLAFVALVTIATFSRGGYIGMAAGCLAFFGASATTRWRRSVAVSLSLACIVAIVATLGVAFGGIQHADRIFGSPDDTNGGLGTRSLLWHLAATFWKAHPLLGVGPGNFEVRALPIAGVHTHANSWLLNTLAEQGVFGALALVMLLAGTIAAVTRRVQAPIAVAACAATVGFVFHQLFDTLWVYPKVTILWWIIVAIGAASLDWQDIVDFARDIPAIDRQRSDPS